MGYLDNSTIVVDAVLTKQGRKLLALGQGLNISYFTLSDTGVDYSLWNPDHPSGSAYYGEAIENLPQVEANVNVQYSLQNKLITLDKNSTALPVMDLSDTTLSFTTAAQQNVTAQLLGYNMSGNNSAGVHMLVQDHNVVQPVGAGSPIDITGNALSFLVEQEIPNARLYEIVGTSPFTLGFVPTTNLSSDASTNVTVIDITTGVYNSIAVDVDANIVPQTRLATGKSTQGSKA